MAKYIHLHPDRQRRYVAMVSQRLIDDLRKPVTDEDWARWDLEAEFENMVNGSSAWWLEDA